MTALTDEFLKDVAEQWYKAAMEGQPLEKTLVAHYGRPADTVNRWIALARKRGFLVR